MDTLRRREQRSGLVVTNANGNPPVRQTACGIRGLPAQFIGLAWACRFSVDVASRNSLLLAGSDARVLVLLERAIRKCQVEIARPSVGTFN